MKRDQQEKVKSHHQERETRRKVNQQVKNFGGAHTQNPKKEKCKKKKMKGGTSTWRKRGEKSMKLRKCEEKKFKSSCGYRGTIVFAKEK